MKSFFKEYFSITKQDRNSILVLVGIIFIIIAVKFFVLPYYKNVSTTIEQKKQDSIMRLFTAQIEMSKVESININEEEAMQKSSEIIASKTNSVAISIHQKFNPNEFKYEDWRSAGFPEKFAKTISNYLAKGGKFRKPEDLKKVYGMKGDWYQQIAPYVVIPDKKIENNNLVKETYSKRNLPVIEINTADSTMLESLPLIGGKTAIKIIKYRNLLGGFVSVNQLKEVWGFKDSILIINEKRINIDASKISKLNINSISFDQLKKHPYVKFNKAKLIIAYRDQHGKFHNANELKNSKAITDEDISKLLPYLNFE